MQAAWPCAAPPAAVYAADRARGTAHSLAEAVLSGLPAHDEAVALARAAAAAGKSIQEVAAWGREADYSATAYRVAARGRIQTGGTTVRRRRCWDKGCSGCCIWGCRLQGWDAVLAAGGAARCA